MELILREQATCSPQMVGIHAVGQVEDAVSVVAVPLDGSELIGECSGELPIFDASLAKEPVVGPGSRHRLAHRHHQSGVGHRLGDSIHGTPPSEVVGGGFAEQLSVRCLPELIGIPIEALTEVIREELELLRCEERPGVGVQIAVERRGTCAHGSDHEEVGEAVGGHGHMFAACRLASGLRSLACGCVTTTNPEALPLGKQLTYATGQLGWSILANIVGINLVFFYLPPDSAGLPTLIASTTFLGVLNAVVLIAASGRLLDAITDPLIASFSDRLRNPSGRRIPFMRWAAIPAAVFLTLMFIPPVGEMSGWNIVWLVVVQAFFYVALTAYVTPFFALLPELGHTARERLNLSTWISITFALGIILGGSVPILAGMIEDGGIDRLRSYQIAIGGLALLAIVLMYVPVWTIDERRYARAEPSSIPMGQAIRSTFRNIHFRYYVVADFAYWTGLTIVQTGLLFYVTVLLLQSDELASFLLIVLVLVSFFFYPVVNVLAKGLGKKPLMVGAFLFMAIVFAGIWFLGRIGLGLLRS